MYMCAKRNLIFLVLVHSSIGALFENEFFPDQSGSILSTISTTLSSTNFTRFYKNNLTLSGDAQISTNGSIYLVEKLVSNSTGIAWIKTPFSIFGSDFACDMNSFSVSFSATIFDTNCSNEGFAINFVGANDPTILNSNGTLGQLGMPTGYVGKVGSISVEFNSFGDSSVNESHIGTDRSLSSFSNWYLLYTFPVNQTFYVWVDYSYFSSRLEVYLTLDGTKPTSPSYSHTENLCLDLKPSSCAECQTESNVYVGFSASVTTCKSYPVIHSFSFTSLNESLQQTLQVPNSVTANFASEESGFILSGDVAKDTTANPPSVKVYNNPGSAYYQSPMQVLRDNPECEASSIRAYFKISVATGDPGGFEGMAFNMIGAALGKKIFSDRTYGEYLGMPTSLFNETGALSVEFDSYDNYDINKDSYDIREPHVGVDLNFNLRSATTVGSPLVNVFLNVWVQYFSKAKSLQIFVSCLEFPSTPYLTYDVDLCEVLRNPTCSTSCQNETNVVVGFSGSSGTKSSTGYLYTFEFSTFWETVADNLAVNASIAESPPFPGFINRGSASTATGDLELMPLDYSQFGSAYYSKTFEVLRYVNVTETDELACESASFQAFFSLQIVSNPSVCFGDAFTFTMVGANPGDVVRSEIQRQWNGMPSNLVRLAGAFTVEFDYYYGNFEDRNIGESHVGIDLNFNTTSVAVRPFSPLNDTLYNVWVVYNASTELFQVFVANGSTLDRPSDAFLNYSGSFCSIMRPPYCSRCQNETSVYVGFTANSGGCVSKPQIKNFTFSTNWENYIPSITPPTASPSTSPTTSPSPISGGSRASSIAIIAGLSVALGLTVIAGLTFFLMFCFFFKNKQYKKLNSKKVIEQEFGVYSNIPKYSLAEVIEATDNFSQMNFLGMGGFADVYKGRSPIGVPWAVKKSNIVNERAKELFNSEIRRMSEMNHTNVVALLGYCDDDDVLILIYEFMALGSLRSVLSRESEDKPLLSFLDRVNIALDIAEGLKYFHKLSNKSFIHRDIKSDNILLSSVKQAKLADFGLLRDLKHHNNSKEVSKTGLVGTPGYIDPDYINSMRPTTMSDIYSFGIVLLELITGKEAIVKDENNQERQSLLRWVLSRLKNENIIHSNLEGNYPTESMDDLLKLALMCTNRNGSMRPHVDTVFFKLCEIKHSIQEVQESFAVEVESDRDYLQELHDNYLSSISVSGGYNNRDVTNGSLVPR